MADVSARFDRPEHYDLADTLRSLSQGKFDPAIRIERNEAWQATWMPAGPVTMRLIDRGNALSFEAWGPGAEDAGERAAGLFGLLDDPDAFRPDHPALVEGYKRRRHHRLTNCGRIVLPMVPIILGQLVTVRDAMRGWTRLCREFGHEAPGPPDAPVRLPPSPAELAALPMWAYRTCAIGQKHSQIIIRVCQRAKRLEALRVHRPAELARRLETLRGIGPWTTGNLLGNALGWPDAVAVGDLHLPKAVCAAMGEPDGDDPKMLELLEPFRPHRKRAVIYLLAGHRTRRTHPRAGIAKHRLRE